MKISLPIKLGAAVVLLFAVVIATCLLWTPVHIQHYAAKLQSDNPRERVSAIGGLLALGPKGLDVLAKELAGGMKAVKLLEENWKDYNKPMDGVYEDYYPLHIACESGFSDAAEILLLKGADHNVINPFGKTPLHCAAEKGHKRIVASLIQAGADLKKRDELDRRTPLHWAAYEGQKDVIVFLLEKGSTLSAKDHEENTPLHLASAEGQLEAVAVLIDNGAEVGCEDEGKSTPLHNAAGGGHKEVVEFLIAKGAKVNACSEDGFTPLHAAAGNGNDEVIELLINKGADVNATIDVGYSVLDFALIAEEKATANLLRSLGGKTGEELKASKVERQRSSVKEEEKK